MSFQALIRGATHLCFRFAEVSQANKPGEHRHDEKQACDTDETPTEHLQRNSKMTVNKSDPDDERQSEVGGCPERRGRRSCVKTHSLKLSALMRANQHHVATIK